MGRRIAAFDWSHSLGAIAGWPPGLCTTVGLLLYSPVPIVLLWGEDGIMIYNDAYAVFAGARHPALLGTRVREGWPEVADFNDNVMKTCLAGATLAYKDQELTLYRSGRPEQVWMNLDYSPTVDGYGRPQGVIAIVVETTARVLSERRIARERAQFARLFDQAPTFMAMLSGPEHRIDFANPGYFRLIGNRPLIGRTIAEALPETRAQGFVDLLDTVYNTGQAFAAVGLRYTIPGAADSVIERYIDFVYQPITDETGRVEGVFVDGVDATKRVAGERRREALIEVTDALRALTDPAEIGAVAARILGQSLQVSRVGYGTIDLQSDTLLVERDWTMPGVASLAGSTKLRDYGSFVDSLKAGHAVRITDVRQDPRTYDPAAVAKLEQLHARSFANFPIMEQNLLVGVLFANHAQPRNWSDDDMTIIREVGERTRAAMEHSRVAVALRDSEAHLRAANELLEQRVRTRTAALQQSENNIRTMIESSNLYQGLLAVDGTVVHANRTSLSGIDQGLDQVTGRLFWETAWFTATPGMPDLIRDAVGRVRQGESITTTMTLNLPAGRRMFEFSLRPVLDEGGAVTAMVPEAVDVTSRVQAEEALRQSQKMEAVGQLTGGLAHDFNNLLTGISGSLELLQNRLAQGRLSAADRYISAAQGAARRAAALTHRLLAFSRRQTLDPRPVDVNRLVAGMEDLIRRTAGPAIYIEVVQAVGLWPTLLDPHQLENALLNLCINARDAMPDGGRITIETANKWLDERAAQERDVPPGQYISLCVTDTGTGMTPEIAARAFDPFFTTKPLGEGTGLGLSMIYGFARQSGGQVRIYTELGIGTTMCLYLPRNHAAPVEDAAAAEPGTAPQGEGEVVLVIDDEPTVRMLITEVLEECNYAHIEAADGPTGLKVVRSGARIDLLITDVGLPGGMNGRQIADAAQALRPGLKVLFITGYAENAVIGNGHLAPDMHVLTKPFEMQTLAQRVRAIIEG